MAEEKKGFILYADLIHTVGHLTDEQAGNLFKHILEYVNDKNPVTENVITKLTFEPIRQQLKRDLVKYEGVKGKKSISGREGNLKRWNEDVYNEYKKGRCTLEEAESIAQNRKASHPDKVQSHSIAKIAVNVNDNVNDNVINTNIPTLEEFISHAVERKKNVCTEEVRLKYFAWVDNNWSITRNNKTEPIKNWKSSLTNTVKYLGEAYKQPSKPIEETFEERIIRLNLEAKANG